MRSVVSWGWQKWSLHQLWNEKTLAITKKFTEIPVIHPFIEDDEFESAEELHEDVITMWPFGEGFVTFQKQSSYSPLFCLDFSAVAGGRASFMLMKRAVSWGSLRIPVGLCYSFWAISSLLLSESVKGTRKDCSHLEPEVLTRGSVPKKWTQVSGHRHLRHWVRHCS